MNQRKGQRMKFEDISLIENEYKESILERIIQHIPVGSSYATGGKELDTIIGFESERERKRTFEYLRKQGYLICANEKGYFMPSTVNEIRQYVRKVNRRIATESETIREPYKYLKEHDAQIEGQITFDDFEDDYGV